MFWEEIIQVKMSEVSVEVRFKSILDLITGETIHNSVVSKAWEETIDKQHN